MEQKARMTAPSCLQVDNKRFLNSHFSRTCDCLGDHQYGNTLAMLQVKRSRTYATAIGGAADNDFTLSLLLNDLSAVEADIQVKRQQ